MSMKETPVNVGYVFFLVFYASSLSSHFLQWFAYKNLIFKPDRYVSILYQNQKQNLYIWFIQWFTPYCKWLMKCQGCFDTKNQGHIQGNNREQLKEVEKKKCCWEEANFWFLKQISCSISAWKCDHASFCSRKVLTHVRCFSWRYL